MSASFELATPARVVFGEGRVAEVAPAARALGRRAFVVTGRDPGRAASLLGALREAGLELDTYAVGGEPTVDVAREATARARALRAELVIGFGGGSALDAAKAVAGLAASPGDPLDYLEVVGAGRPLEAALPFIGVPTTAGTGSEVTRNAVLAVHERGVKVSLRSPLLLARLAVIDPRLTWSAPAALTAATGLDALTQVIEPFTSSRANPWTDALCRDAIPRGARALPRAWADGSDAAARGDMALVSLAGGLALANAGLGAAHGFAGPIGGRFDAPHGAVCARLLPAVMATNLRALDARAPGSPARRRYDELAALLTGRPEATAEDGVTWMEALVRQLQVLRLSSYGLSLDAAEDLIPAAAASSSMKANPITLERSELREILVASL